MAAEGRAHVAHHQIGAGVGVVETAQTTWSKYILELGCIQAKEGHGFLAAVAVAEVDAEVLHELVVHHRLWRADGAVEEGLQARSADVVYAGQAQHVELVEGQGGLHRPQGLDLAAHADR